MKFALFIIFAALLAQTSLSFAFENIELKSEFKELSFIKNGKNPSDLSGVTWSPETRSYFLILNKLGLVYETDENFSLKRTITITGIGDSEEIVFLGMQESEGHNYPEVAISEESGLISILTITEKNFYDTAKDAHQFTINVDNENWGNKGIEGLAYDKVNKVFYAAKEIKPMAIFKFQRPVDSSIKKVKPTLLFSDIQLKKHISDISGLFFNQETKRLMILSHESYCLLDMQEDGKLVSKYNLSTYISKKLFSSLKSQFEGVSIGKDGDLVLTSEPYHYQQFDLSGSSLNY
ncbi:SdiA-regulated domain-containing protein [Bacteriovorax sp. PP10]|uniref:SdiA-regulated domain-containing protein n=1 Tax=Bacteriovorax antarcticus TaxID=3088717 RepID=A0ABU5VQT6_9BACT|nr:SdiA-regulated domain-containing protein [Bacteriovorax sp. PP10]MEA9355398.1 SdiA-regulated domain-containing protein [Bacteriovorax sp. PP10]